MAGDRETVSISNMSTSDRAAEGSIKLDHRDSIRRPSAKSPHKSPKYGLDCWGDADKPFANITNENNATAKSIALTVWIQQLIKDPKNNYMFRFITFYNEHWYFSFTDNTNRFIFVFQTLSLIESNLLTGR